MSVNLTLRTLTSPYNDTTKGSVLSQAEVDNNFIGLKGEVIYSAQTSGNNVTLKKYNGNDINFNLASFTDVFVTGGTYSSGTAIFTNNTGGTFSVSGFSTGSGSDIFVTGATYSNNTFTFTNNTGGTFNVLFNTVTGLTVTGNTSLQGLTATTVSATTYQNLPTDVFVTGGTYSSGTAIFTNNTGGTFNVSGFSTNLKTITKSVADQSISANTLVEGAFYKITGCATSLYGGTDIILQAVSTSAFTQNGTGIFYNPKYNTYDIWSNLIDITGSDSLTSDYDVSENITGNGGRTGVLIGLPYVNNLYVVSGITGNWSSVTSFSSNSTNNVVNVGGITASTYSAGTKVIWGGKVWVNLTGSAGTSVDIFTLDNINWSGVSYNKNDYNIVYDYIEYEYIYDNISYRKDFVGLNEVSSPFGAMMGFNWDYNAIKCFPFGSETVLLSKFNTCRLENLINFNGDTMVNINAEVVSTFDFSYWGRNSFFIDINIGRFGNISNCINGDNRFFAYITTETGKIENVVSSHVSSLGIGLAVVEMGVGTDPLNNDGPSLTNITINGSNSSLNNIKIGLGSTGGPIGLDLVNLVDSNFYRIDVGTGALISNVNLKDSDVYQISMGDGSNISNFTADNCEINSLNLGTNTYLNQITLTDSTFVNVKLEGADNGNTGLAPSYISNLNMIQAEIFSVNIGLSSYIANVFNINDVGPTTIRNINLGIESHISDITFNQTDHTFGNITLGNFANIEEVFIYHSAIFANVILDDVCSIDNIYVGEDSDFNFINVGSQSQITGVQIGVDSDFRNINMLQESGIQNISIGTASTFGYLDMSMASFFTNSSVSDNSSISDITIGEFLGIDGLTSSVQDYGYAIVEKGNNTLEVELDITGLSNIDLSSVFYAGKIQLISSNASETITDITYSNTYPQGGLYPVTFYPSSGLSVTFNGTSVGSMTFPTTQIAMTSASFTASGDTFDSFTVQNVSNSGNSYIKEIDRKTYL